MTSNRQPPEPGASRPAGRPTRIDPGKGERIVETAGPAAGSMSVLVIDDDDEDRHIIARALRKVRPGVEIQEATSAREGLDRLDANPPGLVLLDLRMTGIDGFAVLEGAKTGDHRAEVPMVVLSTSGHPDDVRRAYRLNANAYCIKPSSMAEYERLARSLVEFWMDTAVRVN